MIYLIKYERKIDGKTHDRTATFITRETNQVQIFHHWIKNHTGKFTNSIKLVSIAEKYPPKKYVSTSRDRLGMFLQTPDD